MARRELAHRRLLLGAAREGIRAAIAEPADTYRRLRARHAALDRQRVSGLFDMGYRYGPHQRLRIGMQRLPDDLVGGTILDHLAEIHDHRAGADIADQGEVV